MTRPLPILGDLPTDPTARVKALESRLRLAHPAARPGVQRQLDAARIAARDDGAGADHRDPYVGDGADGARRSAQIDREEADGLDRGTPRYELLLESAAAWDRQAEELEALEADPPRLTFHSTVRGEEGPVSMPLRPGDYTEADPDRLWT